MFKKKVSVNDNLISIFDYINNSKILSFKELLQFILDYDLYKEYYLNQHIVHRLLDEHNNNFKEDISYDPMNML